jgi:hypothetical protein
MSFQLESDIEDLDVEEGEEDFLGFRRFSSFLSGETVGTLEQVSPSNSGEYPDKRGDSADEQADADAAMRAEDNEDDFLGFRRLSSFLQGDVPTEDRGESGADAGDEEQDEDELAEEDFFSSGIQRLSVFMQSSPGGQEPAELSDESEQSLRSSLHRLSETFTLLAPVQEEGLTANQDGARSDLVDIPLNDADKSQEEKIWEDEFDAEWESTRELKRRGSLDRMARQQRLLKTNDDLHQQIVNLQHSLGRAQEGPQSAFVGALQGMLARATSEAAAVEAAKAAAAAAASMVIEAKMAAADAAASSSAEISTLDAALDSLAMAANTGRQSIVMAADVLKAFESVDPAAVVPAPSPCPSGASSLSSSPMPSPMPSPKLEAIVAPSIAAAPLAVEPSVGEEEGGGRRRRSRKAKRRPRASRRRRRRMARSRRNRRSRRSRRSRSRRGRMARRSRRGRRGRKSRRGRRGRRTELLHS